MLELIVIFVGVVADQLTKMWASDTLMNGSIEVIPGVLSFAYAENTGAAFGIFAGATWLLAVVSFVLAVGMSVFLVKTRKEYGSAKYGKIYVISLSMIISGAIGNLIDRVFFGYVVDFIRFDFFTFPVFNIADTLVSIGAVALAVYWLFLMGKSGIDTAKFFDKKVKSTDKTDTEPGTDTETDSQTDIQKDNMKEL